MSCVLTVSSEEWVTLLNDITELGNEITALSNRYPQANQSLLDSAATDLDVALNALGAATTVAGGMRCVSQDVNMLLARADSSISRFTAARVGSGGSGGSGTTTPGTGEKTPSGDSGAYRYNADLSSEGTGASGVLKVLGVAAVAGGVILVVAALTKKKRR